MNIIHHCTNMFVHCIFVANSSLGLSIRLYFTKVGLGTPTDEYYVQVDTGSDLLWVNCAGCSRCPTKSDLGVCFFN